MQNLSRIPLRPFETPTVGHNLLPTTNPLLEILVINPIYVLTLSTLIEL
jgi:hypothetical protein